MAGGGKSSRLIGSLTRESRTGGGEGGRRAPRKIQEGGRGPDLALGSGIGGPWMSSSILHFLSNLALIL